MSYSPVETISAIQNGKEVLFTVGYLDDKIVKLALLPLSFLKYPKRCSRKKRKELRARMIRKGFNRIPRVIEDTQSGGEG